MSDATDQPELPALGFATDLSENDRKDLGAYGEFITANEGDHLIDVRIVVFFFRLIAKHVK